MAADPSSTRQTNAQLIAQLGDMVRTGMDSLRRQIHTCLPGVIKDYDAATQTATVQPALQVKFVDLGWVDLPLCGGVVVIQPAGGAMVETFPIAAGDECVIYFSERSYENWWKEGGTQQQSEVRFHDLSDGFAQVGISNRKRAIGSGGGPDRAPHATAWEVRTRSGDTALRVEPGKISAGVTNTEKAANGETLKAKLEALIDQINLLTVNTAVGPSSPPINIADFTAIKASLSAILSNTVVIQK